ncbi:SMI1/KNR4 family protein [Corallococcus interemptor]|uniref:SMI1/KNR4 family protein n=1 Tax=Corallococcus interemptor TaxID=2316720 RepID=A0A3A8PPC2_9BACT|nr:SMI1/KNR4 family protein [Corallococcus interemptor]RKH39707.1 SMI1/KNR4 family protein [Corallococcus sp. AB050B]RKH58019.1 SMI1/KNR4 family protein [Corallococcus interemptor]
MAMDSLLAEVSRLHFPRPPATPTQIAAFEARVGWNLDADLRAFYLRCDGCTLFETLPDAKYRVLPLDEIQRARRAIRGSDEEEDGEASHYTLVDMQDTNFVLLDVAAAKNGRYPLLDAFHETYPDEAPRIASSFAEFLEKALRSGNRSFWLSSGPLEE